MTGQPGLVILFGSGETSASGRKVYDWLFGQLTSPVKVAVLETPAGFQPNSAWVAEQVADFLRQHLQNHRPQVAVIPARERDTDFSPDDPDIVAPLLQTDVIFLGPGSPTYAVRQLRDSLAWHTLVARHRLEASVIFASAATVAVSKKALPVYEIYKVGEDLHWHDGLDFFGSYGLALAFIPHWNNAEGGANLDTSRCYMGKARFQRLLDLLPSEITVVGIDEHTALAVDLGGRTCRVMGKGGITLLQGGKASFFLRDQTFSVAELGPFQMPEPQCGIPPQVWERVIRAQAKAPQVHRPPSEVIRLVQERETARAEKRWGEADALRERISSLGWQIRDTPSGPHLEPLS